MEVHDIVCSSVWWCVVGDCFVRGRGWWCVVVHDSVCGSVW